VFNSPDGGVPLGRSRWNFTWILTDGQCTKWRKTLPKISIAWVGCTNVTDRQTTDGRTTYSEREHEFTFAQGTDGQTFLPPLNAALYTLRGQKWSGILALATCMHVVCSEKDNKCIFHITSTNLYSSLEFCQVISQVHWETTSTTNGMSVSPN